MKFGYILAKIKDLVRNFGKVSGLAGVTAFLPIIGSAVLLTVIYQLGPWLQQNKESGFVIFVLFMTLFSGLALLATNVLGIVSGFAFAFPLGLLAQLTGLLGASSLMFYLAKRFAAENLLTTIKQKPKMKAIHQALLQENTWKTLFIVVLLRLSPAMPFALTNFLMSAAGISFKTFIIGTLLGMTPRASAVVFVGSSLSELDFSQPQDSWLIITGIAATVLVILTISLLSRKALNNLVTAQS